MSLGLGYSLIDDSFFNEFSNNFAMDFDGTNDYSLAGISGQDPANGTIKPITPAGLTVAAWVKLDIDANSYANTGNYTICGANRNGGYILFYNNKRFSWKVKLIDGDSNSVNTTASCTASKMITPTSASDYGKYLYKSDDWHFVVATWDGDRIKQIYVDGDRSQAGTGAQDGTSGVTQFGSESENSNSKKTENEASPSGTYAIDWDSSNDREEVDFVIGATAAFTQATNATVGNSNFWPGQIGDVAVWDVELSQSEIKALYNLHVPTDMSDTQADNLQGYWKSEEGSGTTVAEETGNVGSDMTLVNGVDNTSTVVPTLDVTGYAGYR
tara:strand:+ start:788 stop:1768 length:981 start_codon:yes stop_codon:yes gene_type:complete